MDGTLLRLPVEISQLRQDLTELFGQWGVHTSFRPLLSSIEQAVVDADLSGATSDEEAAARAYEIRVRHELAAAERAITRPGAEALVAALKHEPAALVSNNTQAAVERAVQRLGLRPAGLLALVGHTPIRPPKPDPTMLIYALGQLDPLPAELICVGDRPVDITMARRAGQALPGVKVTAVGVPGQLEGEAELEAAGADLVLPDLAALVERFF